MERIAQLDQEVAELKSQNTMLGQVNGATSIFPMEIHYRYFYNLLQKNLPNYLRLYLKLQSIFEVVSMPLLTEPAPGDQKYFQ